MKQDTKIGLRIIVVGVLALCVPLVAKLVAATVVGSGVTMVWRTRSKP